MFVIMFLFNVMIMMDIFSKEISICSSSASSIVFPAYCNTVITTLGVQNADTFSIVVQSVAVYISCYIEGRLTVAMFYSSNIYEKLSHYLLQFDVFILSKSNTFLFSLHTQPFFYICLNSLFVSCCSR